MIECKELEGKVVRTVRLYQLGNEGCEVCMEFTDGTSFTTGLKVIGSLEAKMTCGEGLDFQVLRNYVSSDLLRPS